MKSRPEKRLVAIRRGQITLPADVRRRLGIKAGNVLTIEERAGAIVLRPAPILDVDVYSDAEQSRWNKEDGLDEAKRSRILKKLRKRKR